MVCGFGTGADLVQQVITTAQTTGVQLLAENALEGGLYNSGSLNRMLKNAHNFERITLLRLSAGMFEPDDEMAEGFRVREPLAGFLHKFKDINTIQEEGASSEKSPVFASL